MTCCCGYAEQIPAAARVHLLPQSHLYQATADDPAMLDLLLVDSPRPFPISSSIRSTITTSPHSIQPRVFLIHAYLTETMTGAERP
jgi:hypothetical protein